MMRTLTHEPLALAGVLLLLVAIVACLTVWATLLISKLRTDRVASATGAAGPDVPRAEASGPGRTRPQGGGRSAGYARSAEASGTSPGAADTGTKRDFAATQGVTAPEGAPAALSGATPGDLLVRDFRAWQDAGKPGMWPINVVKGSSDV